MTKSQNKSREDRLAEALRANLRRRKRSDVDNKPALIATEPSSEESPE
jgi:hypothetical protein